MNTDSYYREEAIRFWYIDPEKCNTKNVHSAFHSTEYADIGVESL
jgi:hypothetical protein